VGRRPDKGIVRRHGQRALKNRSVPRFGTTDPGPQLDALDKEMAGKGNNARRRFATTAEVCEGLVKLPRDPNKLTRSENLRIEELVAELNAEFEFLRQQLRQRVGEADVDGAEYTAVLMATTMSQIAIMQGAQRGDPKVISSVRQMGAFL
jgi:hypothetical protein